MALNLGLIANETIDDKFFYKRWLTQQKENKQHGYFLVANSIEEYLPLITSPAMNLYLFYAIHAKNETGDSFYSLDTISQKLHVSKKTLTNWNSTLQDAGLITRQTVPNRSSITQLRPTSDFTVNAVDSTAHKRIVAALKEDGFHLKVSIAFVSTGSPKAPKVETFEQWQRIFQVGHQSITRFIILKSPASGNLVNRPEIAGKLAKLDQLAWIDAPQDEEKENSLTVAVPNNMRSSSVIPTILEQLRTVEALKEFKSSYDLFQLD